MLIRSFGKCTDEVKCELFKTYCCNLYASSLWCNFSKSVYKQISVAYNDIFRLLMKIRRGDSISQHFVNRDIRCFKF